MSIKDGAPTGRLNNDGTLMEVECWYESPDGELTRTGERWVPVTDEVRRQITGTAYVSMIDFTPELEKRLRSEEYLPLEVKDVVVAADGHSYATMKINPSDFVRKKAIDAITSPMSGPCSTYSHKASDKQDTVDETQSDRRVEERRVVEENTGFNVNYYSVKIDSPKRPERAPYVFEVEDLIEALNMTFHEGTVLKSLVRSCVERELGMRKVGADYVRDAEKMVHSSKETLRIRNLRAKRGLK